jgi:hypothetical protein
LVRGRSDSTARKLVAGLRDVVGAPQLGVLLPQPLEFGGLFAGGVGPLAGVDLRATPVQLRSVSDATLNFSAIEQILADSEGSPGAR